MTGAPIQNRLSELWSLFDFVFSGKLGVQSVFEAEFVVLISIGGYANASPMKVSTVYRMKAVVNAQLPTKTDHVLFCSLTDDHRAFLASSDICNHPDLLEREHAAGNHDYGNPKISGKMKVVAQVLKVWKEQGHRVLLFAQTQQMLDIIENFMIDTYTYRRMDGLTPVKQRMTLMDEFNNSPDIFTFIFDTKVCLCLLIFYIKLQNGQAHQPRPFVEVLKHGNKTIMKKVMAAPTIHVSAEENLGDPIDIRVDIIHLEPVAAIAFLAATRWEEIEEELLTLRERERANMAKTEGITLRARVKSLELIETWLHGIVRDGREARKRIERQLGLIQEELENLRRSRLP
ncbi:protein chromatin remodeling 8 [Tanacetum coccineum]